MRKKVSHPFTIKAEVRAIGGLRFFSQTQLPKRRKVAHGVVKKRAPSRGRPHWQALNGERPSASVCHPLTERVFLHEGCYTNGPYPWEAIAYGPNDLENLFNSCLAKRCNYMDRSFHSEVRRILPTRTVWQASAPHGILTGPSRQNANLSTQAFRFAAGGRCVQVSEIASLFAFASGSALESRTEELLSEPACIGPQWRSGY